MDTSARASRPSSEKKEQSGQRIKTAFMILVCPWLLSGCFSWKADLTPRSPSRPLTEAQAWLEEADRLAGRADGAENLLSAIRAYEKALEADPECYPALCFLSTYYLLLGDGYTTKVSGKIAHFRTALAYSERAMATHPEFRARIERGDKVWEAADSLTVGQMEAMFFWTTGVFYYYKEGLGPFGQMIHFPWIQRARRVLERMTELDADWGGGGIHFTWGIYYLSIPLAVGGDRKRSEECFSRAVEVGPDRLLNRWGRAKYFHVKMRRPRQFKEDLEWVLSMDGDRSADPPA